MAYIPFRTILTFSAILGKHYQFTFYSLVYSMNRDLMETGCWNGVLQIEPIYYSWSSDDLIHQIIKTRYTQIDAAEVAIKWSEAQAKYLAWIIQMKVTLGLIRCWVFTFEMNRDATDTRHRGSCNPQHRHLQLYQTKTLNSRIDCNEKSVQADSERHWDFPTGDSSFYKPNIT